MIYNPVISGTGTLIARGTLGSDAAAMTVSASIPAGYQYLRLVLQVAESTASTGRNALVQFNGDTTAANYWSYSLVGTGAVAISGNTNAQSGIFLPCANNEGFRSISDICISNNSTDHKVCVATNHYTDSGGTTISDVGGRWTNNAEITSIVIAISGGGNVKAGSKFFLVGYT